MAAQWLVGVNQAWTRTGLLVVHAAVMDVAGRPVGSAPVKVEIFERRRTRTVSDSSAAFTL
jgi:hypothetical protein